MLSYLAQHGIQEPDLPTWAGEEYLEVKVELPQPAVWIVMAHEEIDLYSSLEDGWKGSGSLAPTTTTLSQAKQILSEFAEMAPGLPKPLIGADEEGALSLYWSDDRLLGTVTAYGDGTFSFYLEADGLVKRSDFEAVGEPLSDDVMRLLRAYDRYRRSATEG